MGTIPVGLNTTGTAITIMGTTKTITIVIAMVKKNFIKTRVVGNSRILVIEITQVTGGGIMATMLMA